MSSFKSKFLRLFKKKSSDSQPTPPDTNGAKDALPTDDQANFAPVAQQDSQQQPMGQNKTTASNNVAKPATAQTTGTLTVQLQNASNSSTVYAYITGQALDNNNKLFLLRSDAKTPYYPDNPSSTGASLAQNVSISLGAPGNTVRATIPRLAGARIWFSIGAELVFKVNPGPGLVEPSVFNQADPNIHTNFGFAEFTFNSAQVFANISYVDFVGPPISLSLTDTTGNTQHVSGMPASGLDSVCSALQAQTAKDGQPWSSLIVKYNGANLRVLSPNSGILLNPSWFQNYFTAYVNQVYTRYTTNTLTVDTQASFGNVTGQSKAGPLDFGAGGKFPKPSAADIFSCSTGPFATGSNAETNTIIPRLSAAFNRSTLLATSNIPNGSTPAQYYQNAVTNHYARILHATNLDGRGYAFPYDDVTADGGVPQEGAVFSSNATTMTLAVGGNNAYKA